MYVGRRSGGSPIWGWLSEIAFFDEIPADIIANLTTYVAANYDLGAA
jgi:hypothetical protein